MISGDVTLGPNFIELLSTGKVCLAKTGYQPKCHVKYTVRDWFPAFFC